MAITLSLDATRQLRRSIQRYVAENLEQDIGDLKADALPDHFLKEIGYWKTPAATPEDPR
jgi:uncharacterized protein (DUF2164 family)